APRPSIARRAVVVHSAAQQARTAVISVASSSMPRKLSNCPAKLLPFLSSIRADERTALARSLALRCASHAARSGARIAGAIGVERGGLGERDDEACHKTSASLVSDQRNCAVRVCARFILQPHQLGITVAARRTRR